MRAQVPLSAAIAVQLRNKAASEESERAEIKRLVLRANQDLDLAGMAGTPPQGAWAVPDGRPGGAPAAKTGGYYSRGGSGGGRGRRYSTQRGRGGLP